MCYIDIAEYLLFRKIKTLNASFRQCGDTDIDVDIHIHIHI